MCPPPSQSHRMHQSEGLKSLCSQGGAEREYDWDVAVATGCLGKGVVGVGWSGRVLNVVKVLKVHYVLNIS